MLGAKEWLVIMVSKNALQIVGLGEDKIEMVTIPPTIINNMEIINKDGLYTLITEWLKSHPHTTAEIIWLLAPDICFEHQLTSGEQDKVDSETLQFLDTVPFEEVLSRTYKPLEWRLIVAVNKDLIMSLVQGFTLHGFATRAVVPSKLVQADAQLTSEIEHNAIKRVSELVRESLITPPSPIDTYMPNNSVVVGGAEPKPKSQLPLLLGVFGLLLVVLVVVIFMMR